MPSLIDLGIIQEQRQDTVQLWGMTEADGVSFMHQLMTVTDFASDTILAM